MYNSTTRTLLTIYDECGKRETAIRYFSSMFFLHRPVLYFFLHKDMEYKARPPDNQAMQSDQQSWILESCRKCIENAALIIHFLHQSSTQDCAPHSWVDLQLMMGAYLVLVQAKTTQAFLPIYRSVGDPEALLNFVEHALEASTFRSRKVYRTLEILRDERRSFEASTTPYSAAST